MNKYMKNTLVSILIILNLCRINTQTASQCTSASPNMNADCLSLSSSNLFCCYQTNDGETSKKCVSSDKSLPITSTFTSGGVNYYLDCGVGAGTNTPTGSYNTLNVKNQFINANTLSLPNLPCGVFNPVYLYQCSDFSQMQNSCCFYQSGSSTGCYWLGTKFVGNSTFTGGQIQCAGSYAKTGLYFMIAIILLFI